MYRYSWNKYCDYYKGCSSIATHISKDRIKNCVLHLIPGVLYELIDPAKAVVKCIICNGVGHNRKTCFQSRQVKLKYLRREERKVLGVFPYENGHKK